MLQTDTSKTIYTGAEMILKCLENEGVEYVFGIPGGVVLPIYDAFHNSSLKHILTKHEQAAVHAAEGYAKSTGKVGVALTTSGPGATNSVTGLTDAYYDSVPIVVITGNVSSATLGNDAFQESDIVSMTRSCTKHNYSVRDIKELPAVIKEAFLIAASGRPGPVLVDITKDVVMEQNTLDYPDSVTLLGYNPNFKIETKVFNNIFEEIIKAERPVILCGGGIVAANANDELVKVSEKLDIPVASTLMGLGGFPAQHKNFIGFSGMHGRYEANMAITDSDLLLILGSRLSDRQTGNLSQYCPKAKIAHIDIDPTSLNKNIPANMALLGDMKEILSLMVKKANNVVYSSDHLIKRAQWWNFINDKRGKSSNLNTSINDGKLGPAEVIKKIYEFSDENAIITTEVGQHQMWSAQCFNKNTPRSFITSGGLGTMGFGFPAAIGAKFANPDKQVVLIAGDGSFQMNLQELATCVTYNIPVKIFIINNGYLGMVRQWQSYMFNRYSESKLFSPDYEELAKAYGMKGFKIEKRGELETTIKEAFTLDGPVIVDCIVSEEDDVYPWVPVGNANSEMLMEE